MTDRTHSDVLDALAEKGATSLTRAALRSVLGRPNFLIGSCIILVAAVTAVFAPLLAPHDPTQMFVGPRLSPPNASYLFGTDTLGRDMLSRVIFGSRLSVYVGAVSVSIGLVCGTLIGLGAGYSARLMRTGLMRAIDVLYSFPDILIALALVAFLGPSLTNAMIAVGISVIPYYARVTYSVALVERNKPYFDAALVLGVKPLRLMFRHLLPNVLPPLIVVATLGFSHAVLSAAGLSFLGFGAQPPSPEWGALLADGRNYIVLAPHLMIFPGISIALIVLAFNLVGDSIREYLDPRQRIER
jgi:peptide/nickel transport system permease protein